MTNPLEQFIAIAPPIDDVREDAARCAEETAKMERHERGPLHLTMDAATSEFSGEAAGVAAEVAMEVMRAFRAAGLRATTDTYWDTAAIMLRKGWQRGHKIAPVRVLGEEN